MSLAEAAELVLACPDTTFLLQGPPGIGKSEIVTAAAEAAGYDLILTHPAIGEVAVLGVPDPFWGEVGVAVCVAREGAAAVSEVELAAFLSPKVPRYKMPKRCFFWEALPKSGYGKIPKRLVRDELEARGLLELVAKSTGT